MTKKLLVFFILIFLAIPSSFAWSIFDEAIVEDTDNIVVKDIETEWGNYSDGYGYSVDLYVDNLTSSHDIDAVIFFYNQSKDMIKNFTIVEEPFNDEKMGDNLTLPLGEAVRYDTAKPINVFGMVDSNDTFYNVSYIKIDIFDNTEQKVLFSMNESFNMSNEHSFDNDDSSLDDEIDETDNSDYPTKSDRDYNFFKDTDSDGNDKITFDEFSEISYVFTEDSFWDGYSIEEVLQSEWDRANKNGDDYLTFEEFKKVI